MSKAPKNPWLRKTLRGNSTGLLLAGILCYLFALLFLSELSSKGYIHVGSGIGGFINVSGEEAKATILTFIIVGTICVISSIFIHLRLSFLVKNQIIPEDQPLPPKYVVCPNCEEIYGGYTLPDRMCPKCNIKIEELKNFYASKKKYRKQACSKGLIILLIFVFAPLIYVGVTQLLQYIEVNKCREEGSRYYYSTKKCYRSY